MERGNELGAGQKSGRAGQRLAPCEGKEPRSAGEM